MRNSLNKAQRNAIGRLLNITIYRLMLMYFTDINEIWSRYLSFKRYKESIRPLA